MQPTHCKSVILGNGSVGKSSILSRFTENGFARVYAQTTGCDFFEKRLAIRGDKTVVLQLWDIGGQSIASAMLSKYLHDAQVVLLAYDTTDPQSFADLEDWLEMVRKSCGPTLPHCYLRSWLGLRSSSM